ncbi:hypothetical protein [Nocardia huaxiensis]|uniref:DUF4878 domain-containing protein n=1 Tax=Nocardia huaxiensis TaxID=2755382 RepID=A0A7D6ZA75_9NOCA|nr:hypothetical protein [Nocardia huaxiensis]QLY30748.1 hypothetical protein H0264_37615 [Nocardia huaxiensis]UFS94243.1 hypothetical protein LPY97_26210 [Nocardia huaxiensis]
MSDVDDQPVRIDQGETRTLLPFLVAAGVIVVVIIGIVIAALVSPVEKNVTDSDRLAVAASTFTQSRSGTDVLDPRTACPGFDQKRSPLQPPAGEQAATYEFVRLTDAQLNGDQATAQVTTRTDGVESTSTWHFSKTDNRWLVCNS